MGNRRVRATAIGVLGAVALVLAGCTSGPTASVAPLETAVLVAVGEGEAKAVTDEVTAAQGDVVSTDADGLAEVGFPDGSFMRLGPQSAVTITELGSAEAQRTSIALDIGQTWHNVQDLVAEDAVYEVVTPVGVASVRGTVFAVTCVEGPSCTFLVLEGEVDVDGISVTPYQRITLPEQSEPETLPADTVGEWVTSNIDRDAEAEDAVALPDPPVEAASIAGKWEWSGEIVGSTWVDVPDGAVAETATWTLTQNCETTCEVAVASSNDWDTTGPLSSGVLTFDRNELQPCVDLETGELRVPDAYKTDRGYSLVVDSAEWVDGVWTATRISGTTTTTQSVTAEANAGASACQSYNVDGSALEWGYTTEFTLTPAG